MSRIFQQMTLCTSLSLVNLVALADVRVLFRFDESGHFVHSLTEAPTQKLLRKAVPDKLLITARSAQLAGALSPSDRVEAARARLRDATATLLWFDANGDWLSNSEEPDPRVTHAPAHIEGGGNAQTGLENGAWLATGPDRAAQVTILFPANATLALDWEEWHVDVSTDQQ